MISAIPQFFNATRLAAALALTAMCVCTAVATDKAKNQQPVFHSRHIPKEYLNLNTPTGKAVVRNKLCDTLEPDVLGRLREHGVDLIETRLAWWAMEPEPGRFDWTRIERDIAKIQAAGMRVGLFAWPQHPPAWYNASVPDEDHARYRCLEHGSASTVLSIWDPKTLEVYDRQLKAIAERLGDRLDMVYVAISGDFGEPVTPQGTRHYLFSSPHGHMGFWAGDAKARASFRAFLKKRYASLAELNVAWETSIADWSDDLMPRMPFKNNSLRHRYDFMQWYTGSLASFADRVCALYRRHFPDKTLAIPIGHPNEHLAFGQIKSGLAKTAAKYGMTARWTGCGFLGSFPKSNVLARRIASAAHFYGAPFGTEAALIIEKDNAANALYEGLANGASLIHDDPQNILRSAAIQSRLRPKMIVSPPDTPIAVFYPLESEMLETPGFKVNEFFARCASLRHHADYDLCDSRMIDDGFLRGKTDLLLPVSCHITKSTAAALTKFVRGGGRVWSAAGTTVRVLFTKDTLWDVATRNGLKVPTPPAPPAAGFHQFDDWPHLEPFASLASKDDNDSQAFWTVHREHISRFSPEKQIIVVRPRKP